MLKLDLTIREMLDILETDAVGVPIPLRSLEGVPGLPGAPQDEASLRRKFET